MSIENGGAISVLNDATSARNNTIQNDVSRDGTDEFRGIQGESQIDRLCVVGIVNDGSGVSER